MLIWKATEVQPTSVPVKKAGFDWDAWYEKNKQRLSEKRAKRYREDSAYRAAALERSRHQRAGKKPHVVASTDVSFSQAAVAIGVSIWTLREWRRKNYFPEPLRRNGQLWFSPEQVERLRMLQHFFEVHGVRTTKQTKPDLESLVSLTYANW